MSAEVPVLDADVDDERAVELDATTMAELGVEDGDTVTVQGDDRALARVRRRRYGDAGLAAGDEILAAASLSVGDRAIVAEAAAPPATSVRLAPPRAFRFDGIEAALAAALRGRTVVRGEAVRPALFDGALEVEFVVVDADPALPAAVTDATAVSVRDRPADPADRAGGVTRGYDDVAGLDDAVATLRQLVAFPLENPAAYRDLAGRPPGGVLVTGPPGGGKTLLADAVGAETDAHYVRVPHRDAVDRRYDGGFDGLAVEAIAEAPTVVLLDDVEAMAPARSAGEDGERAATLGSFLDAVADENVAVIGTATDPDDLPASLRRGGRFDHEVELGVPDRDGRLAILRTLADGVARDGDVDLGAVADRTHGFVGADLRALLAEAVRAAVARVADERDGDGAIPTGGTVSVTTSDLEAAVEAVSPSGMRGLDVERPDVSYRDVGGLEDAKLEVVRAVEWPLRYPELLDRVAADAPTGVLLHGLPGTGKTLLARAVAGATDANFLAVQGPELLDRYVGESERGVREVFDRAARNAPSVIFFDEIDALAPERGGGADAEVTERVVSQLLTELDGIEPRSGVVVVGATNRPDVLDPALLRPGRLERVVRVPVPDRAAREEILRVHARDVPTTGVDVARLADETEGYTGSDLEAVVREAGLLAVEDHLRANGADADQVDPGSVVVRSDHFERALGAVAPSVPAEMHEEYEELAEKIRDP